VGGGNDTTGAWMRSGLHINCEKLRFGTAIHTHGGSHWCLRACRHVTARSHHGQLVQKPESSKRYGAVTAGVYARHTIKYRRVAVRYITKSMESEVPKAY
jgi:hypothetical protein